MIEHLETARGRFGVRTAGDSAGALVLCGHGFPDDASTFDALAAGLAAGGRRVVAPYLRGYDPSPLDGSLAFADLVEDLGAVLDALDPVGPVGYVGHDYGAQLGYAALTRWPERFSAAVLLAGVHPAMINRNARRFPRQLWLSRYILLFQLGRIADRAVARGDFAYVDRLWRRWAPGFPPPAEHLREVKDTLRRSMPAPVAMYRGGGFDIPPTPIAVPALFIAGADDGCSLPGLADGQDTLFTAGYQARIWPGVGHFPHLERPAETVRAVTDWLNQNA